MVMILLDTCTLLWLAANQKMLSLKARKIIAKNSSQLCISAISAFEIAIKNKNGKLVLPFSPEKWFTKALDFHGIHEIPVSSDIAIHSASLPSIHNDPCDRIIIATAQLNSMKILTCDSLISKYKVVKVIW